MLSSVLGASQAAQGAASSAIPGDLPQRMPKMPVDDPREKENRAAYRKMLEQAAASGDVHIIDQIAPDAIKAGIDVNPYRSAAKNPSVSTQIQRQMDQSLASVLGLKTPGQSAAATSGGQVAPSDARYNVETGTTQHPLLGPDNVGAVDMGNAAPSETMPESDKLKTKLSDLFTEGYTNRLLAKKAGVEIGEHYGEEKDWWAQYAELKGANPNAKASELVEAMEIKTGWAPDGVVHLKDLSLDESRARADKVFFKYYQDPDIDKAIKKLYPKADHDKVKAGFVVTHMIQQDFTPSDKLMQYAERFVGLRDDQLAMQAEEVSNDVYAKGFAQEKVDAATFGGKLGRDTAMAKMRHDVNQPRLTQSAVKQVASGVGLVNRGQGLMQTIASFTGRGEAFNMEKLPTGIEEVWNQYVDKYGSQKLGFLGLEPNENRIKLRTQTKEFVQYIYDMRGKQISDVEMKAGEALLSSMNESPQQFITKFNEFQQALKVGIDSTLESYKASGYDTGETEALRKQIEQMPNIKDYLQMPQEAPAEKQSYQPPEGYKFTGDVLTSDPTDDKKYTPGKAYQDSNSIYMYLGGGQWRKIGQGGK